MADEPKTGYLRYEDVVHRGEFVEFKSNTEGSLARIEHKLDSNQTNWGVLGTWAGVILTASGLIGGLVAYGLNQQITFQRDTLRAHIATEGHPEAMQKHAAMDKDVSRIDGDIQETRSDLKELKDLQIPIIERLVAIETLQGVHREP